MEGWGERWERVVEDEEVSEAPDSCRESRWLAPLAPLAPDGVACRGLISMAGLCGESGRSEAFAPWMLEVEFMSCSLVSIQTKVESRRRRDSRSRIREAVAGWEPPISSQQARKTADRLVRRKKPRTHENHVFSTVGLAVQEAIPDSLKSAFPESERGVDSEYGDRCTAAVRR